MRIAHSIFLVGAIPIIAAAVIAVAALVFLNQADRARSGAVLAGSAYRNAIVASAARDEYVSAQPNARDAAVDAFREATGAVEADLSRLKEIATGAEHRRAIDQAESVLRREMQLMDRLVAVTRANDARLVEMGERAGRLVDLADEARRRQQVANTELAASLASADRRLRLARRVVDDAHSLRTVASDLARSRASLPPARQRLELSRLAAAAETLGASLAAAGDGAAADIAVRVDAARAALEPGAPGDDAAIGGLIRAIDTAVKTNKTESDALQDEVAELLAYSVQASETDQATQNIATEMLTVAEHTGRALTARDFPAIGSAIGASRDLSQRIATLPISPLIQTEMLDSSTAWRDALRVTADDLSRQSALVRNMEAAGQMLEEEVETLNDLLIAHGERVGGVARTLLVTAALLGLALAAALGLVVARSINRPLQRLQREMLGLVDGTHQGAIAGAGRRDELGDMARATNYFVTELTRRELAMQAAKEDATAALADLRRTQANLIQAEKLASLGQLVAGIAHEINTPLGVALTTATVMAPEVERFEDQTAGGRLSRGALDAFVARMHEGTRLLTANLQRAVHLVQSFKQVAVDQASGDRRTFTVAQWLDDLLVSLGPVTKKSGHRLEVSCPEDFEVDGYPGALAQVLTNLLVNAVAHAYPTGAAPGTLGVAIVRRGERFTITFSDDGRGILPEHRSKVFDPFFTTGRSSGSTGLGLHIVYNLVTGRLGGRIDLKSTVGKGTTFTVDLPLVAPAEAAEPAPVSDFERAAE